MPPRGRSLEPCLRAKRDASIPPESWQSNSPCGQKRVSDLPFALAWNTPHFASESGIDYGIFMRQAHFDAAATAQRMLRDWRALHALTEDWQNRILRSSLPRPAAIRAINALAPLTANTLYTRDGRIVFFCRQKTILEPRLPCPILTRFSLHCSPFSRALLHSICASLRTLQTVSGLMSGTLGNPEIALDVPGETASQLQHVSPLEIPHVLSAFEVTATFINQAALFVQQTGDREFLRAYYPVLKRGAEEIRKESLPPDPFSHCSRERSITWHGCGSIGRKRNSSAVSGAGASSQRSPLPYAFLQKSAFSMLQPLTAC